MPSRRALLAACGTLTLAGCVGSRDDPTVRGSWPHPGYDSTQTGVVDDDRSGPRGPLTVEWERSIAGFSPPRTSPLLEDGTVYVAYTDGPRTGPEVDRTVTIEAFDAATGDSQWTAAATTTRVGGDTYHHADSLVLAGETILVQTANGLCAVGIDGTERWCFDNVSDGQSTHWPIAPAIGDDTVYTGHYRQLGPDEQEPVFYAIDLEDGTERWRYEFDDWDGRIVFSPAIADGVVYLTELREGVKALSTADGTELWSVPLDVDSTPTVADDAVFVTTWDGNDEYGATALEADTGEIRWQVEDRYDGGAPRHLAATEDTVYYDADGRLLARDTATGEHRWENTGRQLISREIDDDAIGEDEGVVVRTGTPAVVGDRIYVGGADLVVIDRETGDVRTRYDTGQRVRTSVAVGDGWLYVNDGSTLYGITDCETELFGRCLR
ncbi:outer membrane protein assembly factor BamB family protein [Natronobacterium texcoconense]|uniref:Outer membrane protein assembly factor BamB, contains PQQ-like beta-propeller repeat n=1 Tax=Natronobacterium texcoconense TaxID=1095778 RepID=A0A1H1FN31_NATTX|nr:PQQ-binding-like beta-propeller repeat protein [Natronobacterium texcoconense]SDR02463.1 Outer membrane protein assembly factor BamB, contains PQQ-like beta-propeller repeat [Natronobacterium texcoconense]